MTFYIFENEKKITYEKYFFWWNAKTQVAQGMIIHLDKKVNYLRLTNNGPVFVAIFFIVGGSG